MTSILDTVLNNTSYRLDQFDREHIAALEARITLKTVGQNSVPYITCLVRGKPIKLTPEECVRQLYLRVLHVDLGYPIHRMAVEYEVTFGREKKRADICVFDKDQTTAPYILVELKKTKLKDGKEQLKSYCNATGAPIGVWTNGQQISYYHRKDPNYFEDIPAIPSAHEKLSDVLSERWTIDDLVNRDKLVNERKSLKDLILEMEDEVLANAGVDVFEELFKLIFTKLYDEWESGRNKKRHLVFKNYGDTETELKAKIQDLFERAKDKWQGVFADGSKIDLTPSHLAVCVASLEKVKLFNSNLDVVDDAFEYLINKSSKGEKGQYFTPRYVIDMCVKMLNPGEHETLIDTAAGSCGFPVHAIFHVWEKIMREEGLSKSHLFTTEDKSARCEDYVQQKVFAIDFDEKTVRVGRTLNLIAGDGQTNVLHLNTLDYERWEENTQDDEWLDVYSEGWRRFKKLRTVKNANRDFQFDVLMANPPFAGDIKETRILAKYDLAHSISFEKTYTVNAKESLIVDASRGMPTFPEALHGSHGGVLYRMADGTYRRVKIKQQNKLGRDILFIERNLQFLKPGGRMAVVLPQGRFNNASDKFLREYIADQCRILAVVGLHSNVFKPHTGTKTSVLFLQKWNDEISQGPLCRRVDDYPIFFATMREPSKDNSGNKIYWEDDEGKPMLDIHGHLIVKHDLFNHDGLTADGIAEAFAEFSKKERLSFFKLSPFDDVRYSRLLRGLEATELMLSEVYDDNDKLRIDSGYFSKPMLEAEQKIRQGKTGYDELGKLFFRFVKGIFDLNADVYVDEGIPFIRIQNLKHGLIDERGMAFIPPDVHQQEGKTALKRGEIVLSKTAYPAASLVTLDACNTSQDTIATTLSEYGRKHYRAPALVAYLNSKYGQTLLWRQFQGNVQLHLALDDGRKVPVPRMSDAFQRSIVGAFNAAEMLLQSAKRSLAMSEEMLMASLGLDIWRQSEALSYVRASHEVFAVSRIDAQFFAPRVKQLLQRLDRDGLRIGDVAPPRHERFEPGTEGTFNYIEIGSLGADGTAVSDALLQLNAPSRATQYVRGGDVITSTVRPIRRLSALVTSDQDGHVCSSGFVVLQPQKISGEVLLAYLRLPVICELMDLHTSATMYPAISEVDLVSLPIPVIDSKVQEKVELRVRQANENHAQALALLDASTRAVEISIEDSESSGLAYLELLRWDEP